MAINLFHDAGLFIYHLWKPPEPSGFARMIKIGSGYVSEIKVFCDGF